MDTLGSQSHQRDGHFSIVHVGTGQDGRDGDLAVGRIQMEFIAAPVIGVAFTVLFGADGAGARQAVHHLGQGHFALSGRDAEML